MPKKLSFRDPVIRLKIQALRIISLMAIALLPGCSGDKSFTITGQLESNKIKNISVSWIEVDKPVFIDSTKVRGNGSFRFRIKADEPGFYQISASKSDFITVLAEPGEKINLTFKGEYLSQGFDVEGSPGTVKIMSLDSALAETKRRVDSLGKVLENEQGKPGYEALSQEVSDKYVDLLKKQRMYNIKFILDNLYSYASIKALYQQIDGNIYVLYDYRDIQYMKIISDTLSRYHPDSKQVKALISNFNRELNAINVNRIEEIAKNATEKNLDPTLEDINGNRISLSSLKGKYVLVAFWSAASSSCVEENLQLKNLYHKYRSHGFEIYQINLDVNEDTWRNAVKYDELPWISVREDDPLKPENAILYNVRGLPANYLYDKTGTIIASNLHNRALQIKLVQLFGN